MLDRKSVSKLNGHALADLCVLIAPAFAGISPLGYVRGKTLMRQVLVRELDCSEAEAELLVDQLEARGFVRFDRPPASDTMTQGTWRIAVPPQAPQESP